MDFVSDQDANGIGRYGRPTVALHWVVALTLIVAVVLGLTLGNTPEEASNRLLKYSPASEPVQRL